MRLRGRARRRSIEKLEADRFDVETLNKRAQKKKKRRASRVEKPTHILESVAGSLLEIEALDDFGDLPGSEENSTAGKSEVGRHIGSYARDGSFLIAIYVVCYDYII